MKRVLITGASGFLGRHCLPLLAEAGYEVHAVASKRVGDTASTVTWHAADLLDRDQASRLISAVRPSHLLHLAWYAKPGAFWTSLENLGWLQASLGIAAEFERCGGRRMVVAGTCAEYDWSHGFCTEGVTPLAPATLYGMCKHSLEQTLAVFAGQTGLSFAWGRLFLLYGPHEPREKLVASVIGSLLAGQVARCSDGRQVRDFLHIEDAARGFLSLLESDRDGQFNVASGAPVTVLEVVTRIGELLERSDLISAGTHGSSESEPPLIVANTRRLRHGLGWRPRYDLDAGLRQTIEWWRRQPC
jgi:nucleoside-diphosphate-sugar epimerase